MELILAILIFWLVVVHRHFLVVVVGGFLALYAIVSAVDWIKTTSTTNLTYVIIAFAVFAVLKAIHTHRI